MSERLPKGVATLAQLAEFDAIIDARSPAEFADDHLPGAINCPALSDEERARVGTLYKQVSAFEAKKVGAALVARNIAHHIEERFLDKSKDWRPLVYCWRGGKRSGAFTHILREIGWDAHRLEGGYKAWRRHLVAELAALPGRFSYQVISGATGSAKSRILEALADGGAQTLHLEELAAHKGSVLGSLPGAPQPSQKTFETRLFMALSKLDPLLPVFVEAESRRIGTVQVPDALIAAIRAAPCIRIEATTTARVDFLLRDYDYFPADPRALAEKLGHLRSLQSNETLARWLELVEFGDFRTLVAELLEKHYDPLYQRSQSRNYHDFADAAAFSADDLSADGIRRLAQAILAT
ncbi:MAG: tRNA 2-selenouridine(34) synthase MnmH [Candidatus Nitricoxidivorans perseverans]|uniref:tRNA 2-selenouridine(34) synthase MnmH n=1 Tax=Candidatus Nitricoxidivorans perseverans TaxID=2975601 RepID=A0AA49FNA0_9PROT|nr:MAG: tRNA 2-selenouridine(34) synthase MnmH [Candidatus Nitricoxidivorans perseverans]